jgi:hypothetical protein
MTLFRDLKEAYTHAVETKSQEFVLDGRVILTGYARYMIEYLELSGARPMCEVTLVEKLE